MTIKNKLGHWQCKLALESHCSVSLLTTILKVSCLVFELSVSPALTPRHLPIYSNCFLKGPLCPPSNQIQKVSALGMFISLIGDIIDVPSLKYLPPIASLILYSCVFCFVLFCFCLFSLLPLGVPPLALLPP